MSPALKKVESYSVQKVTGDGRCLFRALVWLNACCLLFLFRNLKSTGRVLPDPEWVAYLINSVR